MASGVAWLALPFLVLAGGALDAGLGDFGRPMALPTGPMPLPAPAAAPADLGLASPGEGFACTGHCVLDLPAAGDGSGPGHAWVLWDGTRTAGFAAAIEQGGGLQAGVPAFDAVRLARQPGPAVLHVWGSGAFSVEEAAAEAPGVPDLVAIVPSDLGESPEVEMEGHPGCMLEEALEGARLCLRFSSGLANTGAYRLEVAAPGARAVDAAVAMRQGLDGGSVPAGQAAYHASHGHFHYDGLLTFALHPFDPGTGLRGEAVAARAKTGFCMVDWGLTADHGPGTPPKEFWRSDCRPGSPELRMGIGPGWYDLYRWTLPEQFLEMDGVPPGTYELVATVDPAGTLVESSTLDNTASLRFAYQNGRVQPLEGRGFYQF